ncbi:G-type lectin S-receptor-like serine/threonine-protein kinase [Vitis vinifera]|uniref:G-type lectin S-receptor-like serine/threonine-protein kinase n=1 Tax=Vitis vinifera TaxID=29760 RepID=A0A438HS38_VITVI|nr:G-type lectin S-receptor-like serine/threonine-protein kinase [Vitis vinifera]
MEEAMLHELTTSNNFSDSKDVEHDGKRRARDLKPFNFDSIFLHGKLPEEQEIAVKRISRGSRQGLVELKNEIRLIAKLQHMNLVRLLGSYIKGEERC